VLFWLIVLGGRIWYSLKSVLRNTWRWFWLHTRWCFLPVFPLLLRCFQLVLLLWPLHILFSDYSKVKCFLHPINILAIVLFIAPFPIKWTYLLSFRKSLLHLLLTDILLFHLWICQRIANLTSDLHNFLATSSINLDFSIFNIHIIIWSHTFQYIWALFIDLSDRTLFVLLLFSFRAFKTYLLLIWLGWILLFLIVDFVEHTLIGGNSKTDILIFPFWCLFLSDCLPQHLAILILLIQTLSQLENFILFFPHFLVAVRFQLLLWSR